MAVASWWLVVRRGLERDRSAGTLAGRANDADMYAEPASLGTTRAAPSAAGMARRTKGAWNPSAARGRCVWMMLLFRRDYSAWLSRPRNCLSLYRGSWKAPTRSWCLEECSGEGGLRTALERSASAATFDGERRRGVTCGAAVSADLGPGDPPLSVDGG